MSFQSIFFAFLWSFGASMCCAFYFNTTKKHIPWGGLLGAVGWILYELILFYFHSQAMGYMIGAFVVAVFSEIFAIIFKNPATVFLIPGLLPLVPGGGIFSMMRSAILEDLNKAFSTGYDTLVAAASIALGVAVASSLSRVAQSIVSKRLHKNSK